MQRRAVSSCAGADGRCDALARGSPGDACPELSAVGLCLGQSRPWPLSAGSPGLDLGHCLVVVPQTRLPRTTQDPVNQGHGGSLGWRVLLEACPGAVRPSQLWTRHSSCSGLPRVNWNAVCACGARVCACARVYTCACVSVCTRACMCVCVQLCAYVCAHVHFVCASVYMHMCMRTCVHVCTCTLCTCVYMCAHVCHRMDVVLSVSSLASRKVRAGRGLRGDRLFPKGTERGLGRARGRPTAARGAPSCKRTRGPADRGLSSPG